MALSFATSSTQECRHGLTASTVGRVAFCTSQGPLIFPVSFGVVDGAVVFRTSPYTELGTLVVGARVAFEVDDSQPEHEAGWSVVLHGKATRVEDPDEVTRLRRILPEPWASGQRGMYVCVVPTSISGRSLNGRL